MKIIPLTLLSATIITAAGSCASSKTASGEPQPPTTVTTTEMPIPGKMLGGDTTTVKALPQAIIYKTNGNFNNCVPITLSANRKEIVSYPAPSDINSSALPIQLTEGFLLDRRGVGENTAFTRYTYSEYSTLAQAPSLKTLKESIIEGAEITEIIRLPMTTQEAVADTSRCNNLIRNGFPDCDVVLHRHAIQLTPQ